MIGCGAIILKEDYILLIRKGDTWGRPGGKVENGESVEDALLREIQEEAGIQVRIERLLHTQTIIEKGHTWTAYSYLASYVCGEARNMEPEKHDELRWFKLGALPENLQDYVRDSIGYYVDSLRK